MSHRDGIAGLTNHTFAGKPAQPCLNDATEVSVSLTLDLPEDKILGAELDLIEQHFGDLLQEMLLLDNEAKE